MPPTIEEASEIPALGEAYNHARKAYGLTSALLIAWELIGVDLEAAPVESLKLTLKSPQAAPYVLIVLILYFGFRVTIEWYQTDARRRQLRASRVDFVVAHCIAAASLSLYAYQTLAQVQVANAMPQGRVLTFALGVAVGQAVLTVLGRRGLRDVWDDDWWSKATLLLMGTFVLFALGWLLYLVSTSKDVSLFVTAGIGVVIGAGLVILIRKIVWRSS